MNGNMDVEVSYYDGSGWQDLTSLLTGYQIKDEGISNISSGIINLQSIRSDFTSYLTNPYRLLRVQQRPVSTWQPIFFGYVNDPHVKTLAGTHEERTKISLDVLGYESRLAQDTITYDYYKHQSAISPLADSNAFSYRDMMEGFLAIPDSSRDGTGLSGTGFAISAETDAAGIDAIIDGSCNWFKQTLFDAIRSTCEHIGYDGYYRRYSTASFTPTINLYPFNKTSAATITAPFISEPEYNPGKLTDVFNLAYVWGGIDAGIPSDGDRWTEYGYSKYSPAIWSLTANDGTPSIQDVDNTNFTYNQVTYGANSKSVKFLVTASTPNFASIATAKLTLANTESSTIDCQNRISSIPFALYPYMGYAANYAMVTITLEDSSGNKIHYVCVDTAKGSNIASTPSHQPKFYEIPVGTSKEIMSDSLFNSAFLLNPTEYANDSKARTYGNKWYYEDGDSTFDWEHVAALYISVAKFVTGGNSTANFNFEIDALQFVGGLEIKPFEWYSPTLCPPVADASSIATYGIRPIHITDSGITSFEQAQAEATRTLNNLNSPKSTLKIRKPLPEATQLFPSNVITVNSAEYRIKKLIYNWNYGKRKTQSVDYELIEKTASLPPIWTQINELRYLVK